MEQSISNNKTKSQNNTVDNTALSKDSASMIPEIVELLKEFKATDIEVYDVAEKCSYTNTVLIVEANSSIHLNALREQVFQHLKERKIFPITKPNKEVNANWLILDYVDFVIHVCLPKTRETYALDALFNIENKLEKS